MKLFFQMVILDCNIKRLRALALADSAAIIDQAHKDEGSVCCR